MPRSRVTDDGLVEGVVSGLRPRRRTTPACPLSSGAASLEDVERSPQCDVVRWPSGPFAVRSAWVEVRCRAPRRRHAPVLVGRRREAGPVRLGPHESAGDQPCDPKTLHDSGGGQGTLCLQMLRSVTPSLLSLSVLDPAHLRRIERRWLKLRRERFAHARNLALRLTNISVGKLEGTMRGMPVKAHLLICLVAMAATFSVFLNLDERDARATQSVDPAELRLLIESLQEDNQVSQPVQGESSVTSPSSCDLVLSSETTEGEVACLELLASPTSTQSDVSSSALEQPPTWCGTGGTRRITRHKSCAVWRGAINVFDSNSGAPIWRLEFDVVDYSYNAHNVDLFAQQLELRTTSITGAAAGTSVSAFGQCSGDCSVSETDFPTQPACRRRLQQRSGVFRCRRPVSRPGRFWQSLPTFGLQQPGMVEHRHGCGRSARGPV